jgi:hypothetical protein
MKSIYYALTAVLLSAISAAFSSCVPIEPARTPTLDEVRLGSARGPTVADSELRPGEIAGDVTEVNHARQELYLVADNGQRQVVPFDFNRTRVIYHGRDYSVDSLEAGDRVAYQPAPRSRNYVDIIRIQEPVQARSAPPPSRAAAPARPRTDVVEGTVERVDPSLGVFELKPRTGRNVTVSVPYNARQGAIDNFRSLRRGDLVRVEGEFVNSDNLQLLSFLSPSER